MEDKLLLILKVALHHGVTDIHFDIRRDNTLCIEMRIDGEIIAIDDLDADIGFFRYLMYRANLDVSSILTPQTGRFEVELEGNTIALRFALVSSFHLANGVLRILNNHRQLMISDLTMNQDHISWLEEIMSHRSGLYLFSGPTGSGKTTTLYTLLDQVEGKKIFTLEDPVEIYHERYVQLQINEKQDFDYAAGIKQLMRHDPDIIMIGEIRDAIAAEMAVRCALTGHLVVSSIHSSSCINTIERMEELGVPEYQLRDILTGISAQRLYPAVSGGKTGIYEVMDDKEIDYYFIHQCHTPAYHTLRDNIRSAVMKGWIYEKDAAPDLA